MKNKKNLKLNLINLYLKILGDKLNKKNLIYFLIDLKPLEQIEIIKQNYKLIDWSFYSSELSLEKIDLILEHMPIWVNSFQWLAISQRKDISLHFFKKYYNTLVILHVLQNNQFNEEYFVDHWNIFGTAIKNQIFRTQNYSVFFLLKYAKTDTNVLEFMSNFKLKGEGLELRKDLEKEFIESKMKSKDYYKMLQELIYKNKKDKFLKALK